MSIIPYALMAYGTTAVISFAVVAIIVVTDKIVGREEKDDD